MFAREQKLFAAIPMDPQGSARATLYSAEESTKMHQHEKMKKSVGRSYAVANIQPCSFSLGLIVLSLPCRRMF
jgi:hypothetical protein